MKKYPMLVRVVLRIFAILAFSPLVALSGPRDKPDATHTYELWRSAGTRVYGKFIAYKEGKVILERKSGERIELDYARMTRKNRELVKELVEKYPETSTPLPVLEKPKGKRTLVWKQVPLDQIAWPKNIMPAEKAALEALPRKWYAAETEHFIIHYQQEAYARQVARLADFFYAYVGSDMVGLSDRVKGKSHIVILRSQKDWEGFLKAANIETEWAASYVRGNTMYTRDSDRRIGDSETLCHELTHVVVDRFLPRDPPLWLNEGLAEWYGTIGRKAFKGQTVNPSRALGDGLRDIFPMEELFSARRYPEANRVPLYYATCKYFVGFLISEKDLPTFVKAMREITEKRRDPKEVILDLYDFEDLDELEKEFRRYVR